MREAQSHHKLEEIDLEINFNNNDAEIEDGPETKRKNGAETNRQKIQSIGNITVAEGLKERQSEVPQYYDKPFNSKTLGGRMTVQPEYPRDSYYPKNN